METIGKKLSPVLVEIENTLWEFESNVQIKPGFTEDGFRASLKIFMTVILDKMWELQEKENIPQKVREEMATKCGDEVRKLVKTFTNINTFDLYK